MSTYGANQNWRGTVVADPRGRNSAGPPVLVATSFAARLRGVLGRESILAHGGCWLSPCASVHGAGLTRPLDLVFVGADGTILAVGSLSPLGWARWPGAGAVLELGRGQAAAWSLIEGARIRLEPTPRGEQALARPRSVPVPARPALPADGSPGGACLETSTPHIARNDIGRSGTSRTGTPIAAPAGRASAIPRFPHEARPTPGPTDPPGDDP